jgi:AcrR family transcriptional regulator
MSVESRRKREKQVRRRSILDAARAVFAAKGFEASTMDEVAAEAELSKGTLYLYFQSKEDLFVALATEMMGGLLARFERIAAAEGTGLARLRWLLEGYADFALEHAAHFRAVLVWLASGTRADTTTPSFAAHRQQLARIVAMFHGALEAGARDGTIRAEVDPVQVGAQLWAGMIGTLIVRINSEEMMRRAPHAVDFEALVPGYIDIVCRGLSAAAPEASP